MNLREAAQQALKSLEDAIKVWTEEMEFRSCIDASHAWLESYAVLREALSEPEQEPVAWMVYTQDGTSAFVTDNPKDFTDTHRALPLYTAPPQRQPLTEDAMQRLTDVQHEIEKTHTSVDNEYTPVKPLTDEEIETVADSLPADDLGMPTTWHLRLARAIERAHGIGEEE